MKDVTAFGKIGQNFFLLGGGQAASMALGFLMTASLTRALGPSDFGIYILILTIVGFVGVAVDWGQGNSVVREVSRGRADRANFIASAAVLRVAGIAFATVAAYLIAVVSGYTSFIVWLAVFGVLASLPGSFVVFLGYTFRGLDRTDIDVMAGLLAKATATVLTIAALALGGGIAAAVLVPAVGSIAALLYAVRMLRAVDVSFAAPSVATSREIFTAGVPLVAVSLTIAAHGFMEVTLLAMLTNKEVVGWYGSARTLIGLAIAPATILAAASFPELSRAADDTDQFVRLIAASARPLLAVGALATCMLFVFAIPGIRIAFGHGFDGAALVLQVCAAFLPIFFVNFLLGNAAVARQLTTQIAVAKAVCVVLSGIASWFLVRYFQATIGNGGVGVMISFCVSEFLMLATFARLMPRGILREILCGHLLRAYTLAGIAVLVGMAVMPMLPLWAAVVFVLAVFSVAARIVGLVRPTDVDNLFVAIRAAVDQVRRLR